MKNPSRAHAIASIVSVLGMWGCTHAVEETNEEPIGTKQCPVTYATESTVISLEVFGFLQHVMGRGLNGSDLNGRMLDGEHVAFVELDSAVHDGEPMSDVVLEASRFRGRTAGGRRLANRRFAGVEFTAQTDAGGSVTVVVRSARPWLEPGMTDTYLYQVEYAVDGGWSPLCGVDEAGEPIEATALRGRWDYREGVEGGGDKIEDPNAFTFACLGHVAAKCVEMGYKPWREGIVCHIGEGCERQAIGHLHQACTRMMRGDYCGDGRAHTIDGMPINAYDGYGIRYDSDEWELEAEWTPDGASCMARTRRPEAELSCLDALMRPGCGDPLSFVDGTSLISEVPAME